MYKTRTVGYRTRKVRSLGSVSSATSSDIIRPPVVPKNLFKSPLKVARTYPLGVIYKVQHTPPTPARVNPLSRCRKCKHVNLDHKIRGRPPVSLLGKSPRPSSRSLGTRSIGLGNPGTIWSPDTGSIVQQFKANIAISPYVRHYLERKLKNKLLKTSNDIRVLQSLKGLNLGELELVYNVKSQVDSQSEVDESTSVENAGVIPTTATAINPAVRGKTRPIGRRMGAVTLPKTGTACGTEFNLKSSIDHRRNNANATRVTKTSNLATTKSHQYFTRTQARMMAKEKGHNGLSSNASVPDDDLFVLPQMPPLNPRKAKTMASTSKRVVPLIKSYLFKSSAAKQSVPKKLVSKSSTSVLISKTQSIKSRSVAKSKVRPVGPRESNNLVTPVTKSSTIKSRIPRYTGEGLKSKKCY